MMSFNNEQFFAALSHPLRLRVVMLLNQIDELCVCELTQVLDIEQPVLSKQLAQLKRTHILTTRRQGVWMFYQLNKQIPTWCSLVISEVFNGLHSSAPYEDDYRKYQSLNQQSCC